MICRSVARRVATIGVVLALLSPWLPTSEAGGRNETPRIFVHEDGRVFASVWSSLAALWDKNGCSIDPNGCPLPPGHLRPEKEPKPPKDKDPKEPKEPKD